MRGKLFLLIFAVLCFAAPTTARTREIIFDTDWWTDVDDACALRLMLNADKLHQIKLAGVCLSAVDGESFESIRKFLSYEGRADINVGADMEATDYPGKSKWKKTIINSVKEDPAVVNEKAVEDCVDFYRRLLSEANKKVDIVAVGFPNTLARLLESGPDKWSKLNGIQLVRRKVGHLYLMAGKFPEGKEHNICLSERSRSAGLTVASKWPGKIVFLGFEVGIQVKCGGQLPPDDLVHKVLVAHGSAGGRYAWDPLTSWIATLASPQAAGFSTVRGTCVVDPEDGSNSFVTSPKGHHCYVTMDHEPSWYTTRLDAMLQK